MSDYKNHYQKYKFKCKKCNNIRFCTIKNIKKTNCVFCNNRKISLTSIKTFCLNKNIKFLNSEVLKKKDKHSFQCLICNNIWQATLKNVYDKKSGCPFCKDGRWEKEIRNIFEEITGHKFFKIKPDWLINPKTKKRLELDGYCEQLKIAFEYQGQQHFEEVKKFKMNKERLIYQKFKDEVKRKICKEKGINLIEIPQIGKYMPDKFLKFYIKINLNY